MQQWGLAGEDLCILQQKHTADVLHVTQNWEVENMPIADAMVTHIPGLALGILTADCTPVLYADAEAGIIGAAHAGWKGARAGIVENTVKAMIGLGACPSRITASIGPCIQQSSYEIGPEFYECFVQDKAENSRFFIPSVKPTHFMFDMAGFVTEKLQQAGITHIHNMQRDTCSDEEHFFSYRRSCLRGDLYRMNGLSAIMLVE